MRSEAEIQARIEQLERQASEHAAGCGEAPSETVAEIRALKWVLEGTAGDTQPSTTPQSRQSRDGFKK